MNKTLRNIIALISGLILGSLVNMLIISISNYIVPLPLGVDPEDLESIKANIHLYQGKHYIMPWLAHALGTLVGAFVAAKIAVTNKLKLALVIGCFFLIGGIMVAFMLPSPTWFILADLVLAYIPMAFIGRKLAGK